MSLSVPLTKTNAGKLWGHLILTETKRSGGEESLSALEILRRYTPQNDNPPDSSSLY